MRSNIKLGHISGIEIGLHYSWLIIAALIVNGLFSAAGLIPHARPTRADIFGSIRIDYKLVTNVLGVAIFAGLFAVTLRRGATDPVCGMKVDRLKALHKDTLGGMVYFCSEECMHEFEADPRHHEQAAEALTPAARRASSPRSGER